MNFIEAYKEASNGKLVRMKGWSNRHRYMTRLPDAVPENVVIIGLKAPVRFIRSVEETRIRDGNGVEQASGIPTAAAAEEERLGAVPYVAHHADILGKWEYWEAPAGTDV